GIDVGQAAGDKTGPAGCLPDCRLGRRLDAIVEEFEALPGDRRLEGVGDDRARDDALARKRHADEGVPPPVRRTAGTALLAVALGDATMVAAALERAVKPGFERMIGRLEGEYHDGVAAVAGAVLEGLAGIEDAAVRRIEAGLRDSTYGPAGGHE